MSFNSSLSTSSSTQSSLDCSDEARLEPREEVFKTYRRRWLVLFAGFWLVFVPSLHRCLLSVQNIFNDHVGITVKEFDRAFQLCMATTCIFIIPMARLMDRFGLRRMVYACLGLMIAGNLCKALCCAHDRYVPIWVRNHRYLLLILSEAFNGFSASIHNLFSPKIATNWFPHHESTVALFLVNVGYSVGIAASSYLTPLFIKTAFDLTKLSYVFLISAILITVLAPLCLTRSKPRSPPSSTAVLSATTRVPLHVGLCVLLRCSSFILALLALIAINNPASVVQVNTEDILAKKHYSNSFSGLLIAQGYSLGIFAGLLGASWVDRSKDYVRVSRLGAIMFGAATSFLYASLLLAGIPHIIELANASITIGNAVANPAIMQTTIRLSAGVMTEASVSAFIVLLQSTTGIALIYLLEPFKKLSTGTDPYTAPLLINASLVMILCMSYAAFFKLPSKEKVQSKFYPKFTQFLSTDS